MSAAVAGSISPALLAPSVTSTITLLFAFERRRRVRAVARPEPMAVPSGSMSRCTSSSWRRRTAVSVVGGDLVRLRAAKITRPDAVARPALHELRHHLLRHGRGGFAAGSPRPPSSPRRRGRPRCRRPRVVTSSRRVPCCGRARATAAATRPRAASTGRRVAQAHPPARGAGARGARRPGRRRPCPRARAEGRAPSEERGRERDQQPRRVLEAEAGPVHQAAFPAAGTAGSAGRSRASSAGTSARTAAEVPLGLLGQALPLART